MIKTNSSDELFLTNTFGDFGSFNDGFSLIINGSTVATINKIKEFSGALIKFNASGVYQWNCRFASPDANGASMNGLNIDNANNIIVSCGRQGIPARVYDRYGNNGGILPASQGDTGTLLKINADGTFSNTYGYIETIRYESFSLNALDVNQNIYVLGTAFIFPTSDIKDLNIYDKNGYVTLINLDETYQTSYICLLKYNSSTTLNKISL